MLERYDSVILALDTGMISFGRSKEDEWLSNLFLMNTIEDAERQLLLRLRMRIHLSGSKCHFFSGDSQKVLPR